MDIIDTLKIRVPHQPGTTVMVRREADDENSWFRSAVVDQKGTVAFPEVPTAPGRHFVPFESGVKYVAYSNGQAVPFTCPFPETAYWD